MEGYETLKHLINDSYRAAQRTIAGITAAAMISLPYNSNVRADEAPAQNPPAAAPAQSEVGKIQASPPGSAPNTKPYDAVLSTDKQEYSPGETITFSFSAKDNDGNLVEYIFRPTGATENPINKNFEKTGEYRGTATYGLSRDVLDSLDSSSGLTLDSKKYGAVIDFLDDKPSSASAIAEYIVRRAQEPVATTAPAEPAPSPAPEQAPSQTDVPECSDNAVKEYAKGLLKQGSNAVYVRVDTGTSVSLERRDLESGLALGSLVTTPALHGVDKEFADKQLHFVYTLTGVEETPNEPDSYTVTNNRGSIDVKLVGTNCDGNEEAFAERDVSYNLNRDEEKKRGAAVAAFIVGGLLHAGAVVLGGYCLEGNCEPQGTLPPQPRRGTGGQVGDGNLVK